MRTRSTRPLALLGLTLACGGCFALFTLDGFGPPASIPAGEDGAPVEVDGAAVLDATVDATILSGKIVFVTNTEFTVGSPLGVFTVAGAHDQCNKAAARAGLSGTYLAWIVGNSKDTVAFPGILDASADKNRFVLLDNRVVAGSLAELRDSGPRVAIVMTEEGKALPEAPEAPADREPPDGCPDSGLVWTAVKGQDSDDPKDCTSWAVGNAGQNGGVGRMAKHKTEWTYVCDQSCSKRARLYCFQQ